MTEQEQGAKAWMESDMEHGRHVYCLRTWPMSNRAEPLPEHERAIYSGNPGIAVSEKVANSMFEGE